MKFPAPHNPDSAFVEKTRRAFLSAYEARFPRALAPRRGWRYAARGLAAAIGAAVLISGASVYADERNVGPGNMLYSLKRSKEAVQLFFTSKEERPLMHAG
ncbi:MAG: hypothetical protein HY436_01945, partial [Candidatus Liptonbacteria bacterium]|nr:hypothetical protein [Candidatus Liptonbacteria bacterium]